MYADIMNYIKSIQETNPILSVALGAIFYILFPTQAFWAAATGVLILMLVDIGTKYYAISIQEGGLFKAFKNKKISSESLWRGTSRKIIVYFTFFIMAGISYRITPISAISSIISTIIYSMLFFRECQSIGENLRDAGGDVGWFLAVVSKKQKKILEDEGVNEDDEQY